MAQFETISHGEANWEQKINKNFNNVTQDSGWVDIPILAPATSSNFQMRLLNQVLYLTGGVTPNVSELVPVAILPFKNRRFTAVDPTGNVVACYVDDKGNLMISKRTESNMSDYINVGYNSFLLGNIDLGG